MRLTGLMPVSLWSLTAKSVSAFNLLPIGVNRSIMNRSGSLEPYVSCMYSISNDEYLPKGDWLDTCEVVSSSPQPEGKVTVIANCSDDEGRLITNNIYVNRDARLVNLDGELMVIQKPDSIPSIDCKVLGVDHIAIFVQDLDASVAFYQMLGFTIIRKPDGVEGHWLYDETLNFGIHLTQSQDLKSNSARKTSKVKNEINLNATHLSLITNESLFEFANKLRGLGVESKINTLTFNDKKTYQVFIQDPDGNLFEFVEKEFKQFLKSLASQTPLNNEPLKNKSNINRYIAFNNQDYIQFKNQPLFNRISVKDDNFATYTLGKIEEVGFRVGVGKRRRDREINKFEIVKDNRVYLLDAVVALGLYEVYYNLFKNIEHDQNKEREKKSTKFLVEAIGGNQVLIRGNLNTIEESVKVKITQGARDRVLLDIEFKNFMSTYKALEKLISLIN